MNSNITCSEGYSVYSEFVVHDTCAVDIITDYVLKWCIIIISIVIIIIQILNLVLGRGNTLNKKIIPATITITSIVNIIFLLLHPINSLITNNKSYNTVFSSSIIHVGTSFTANILILYMYNIFNIVNNVNFIVKKQHVRIILSIADCVQFAILYLLGFSYHIDDTMKKYCNIIFWIPILVFYLLSIPIFIISSKYLYIMSRDNLKLLPRIKLVIICLVNSVCAVTISLLCMYKISIDWLLFDIFWLFSICLNFSIYYIIINEEHDNDDNDDNNNEVSTVKASHPKDIDY